MKTIEEIISSLDQQLLYAEKVSDDSSARFMLDAQVERVGKYVLVMLGQRGLAIPIARLAEIGHLPPVTELPNLPGWIRGIVNLRGEIVSVIDLLEFLSLGTMESSSRDQRLAVLQSGKIKVGILVDRIVATVNHPDSDLQARQKGQRNTRADIVFSHSLTVDSGTYDILDIGSLLSLKSLRNYYEAE